MSCNQAPALASVLGSSLVVVWCEVTFVSFVSQKMYNELHVAKASELCAHYLSYLPVILIVLTIDCVVR